MPAVQVVFRGTGSLRSSSCLQGVCSLVGRKGTRCCGNDRCCHGWERRGSGGGWKGLQAVVAVARKVTLRGMGRGKEGRKIYFRKTGS